MSPVHEEMWPKAAQATIANNTSLSAAVELTGYLLAGVSIPIATGWTTANLTFQVSLDNGATFFNLYKNDGSGTFTEYTLTVPAGLTTAGFLPVPLQDFAAFTHIKVRSGTAGTPVNQGADRVLQIGRMP